MGRAESEINQGGRLSHRSCLHAPKGFPFNVFQDQYQLFGILIYDQEEYMSALLMDPDGPVQLKRSCCHLLV